MRCQSRHCPKATLTGTPLAEPAQPSSHEDLAMQQHLRMMGMHGGDGDFDGDDGDMDPMMAHIARRMGALRAPSQSARRKGIQDEVEAKLAQEFDARLQTTPPEEAAVIALSPDAVALCASLQNALRGRFLKLPAGWVDAQSLPRNVSELHGSCRLPRFFEIRYIS
jgi:hypothetical protein